MLEERGADLILDEKKNFNVPKIESYTYHT